jgi:DNA-binding CsgD family transcriptional regulator/pimeloyl-ACP methyl ester carboxylesterase
MRLGSGPKLVVVPPVPFSNVSGDWSIPIMRDVYQRLAASFELILYDGRGTGASQRSVEDLSTSALVADLEAVLDDAEAEEVALLALYLACPPAVTFAARQPHRVSHLVLFGAADLGAKSFDRSGTAALLTLIEKDWDLFTQTAALDWMGWDAGESGQLVAESFRTTTTPTIAKAALAMYGPSDLTPLLSATRAETLVLHRRDGRQVPIEQSADLAAAIPKGQLHVLEGDSATLFFVDPDGTVDLITSFVRPGYATQPVHMSRPGSGAQLTHREEEVLRLIAAGESNAEIAHRLGLSVHTVERHAANIYRKIDARGRADATAWALRNGVA